MAEEENKKEEQKEIDKSQIETALCARIQLFKEDADNYTLEKVRRLIEKDLGIEKYALDVHKRFIKRFLEEQMESADEVNAPKDAKDTEEDVKNNVEKSPKKEVEKSAEEPNTKEDVKNSGSEDEKKSDESPIMGVIYSKFKPMDSEEDAKVSESSIKKAIREKMAHFRANAETMTLASVRRYLEEEMGLEKNALDPFKKFVQQEIDKVLSASEVPKSKSSVEKKKTSAKQSKPAKKIVKKGTSDSSDSESDEAEHRVKSVKKAVPKGKNEKSEGLKKRKIVNTKADAASKKQKVVKKPSVSNDAESDGSDSEDSESQSTAKPARKKAAPAAGYGEHIENLKSIIKACGMSIPPVIYKKAKQVPEDEREDFLSKELAEILSREGLSTDPSEKEIKEVRKKKQRAKELEGIDISNIVSSSRRRSTTSFVPPPKPKSPVKDDKSDAEDSEKDDSSNDSGSEEDDDGSQVDEPSDDNDEGSD